MHLNNILSKVAIIVTYTALFFVAVYFGKPAIMTDGIFFLVGLILGWAILEADESYFFQYYLEKKQIDAGKKHLVTRSLLFMFSLLPLGFYLLTSTGSVIGVGLFLSIVSVLALEMYMLKNDSQAFHDRFLSQLQRKLSNSEIQRVTYLVIALAVLFGILVIFAGR